MLVGVPKEIKNHEYRIGVTPAGVRELVQNGHQVIVEKNGGEAIGLTNEAYTVAGAKLVETAEEVFVQSDMIVKVKEPQPHECKMLQKDQILFTYLHLAPDPIQTKLLLESGVVAIAYETVTDDRNGLPLLSPMSEVAGRMSIQAGAHCLEKAQGGNGILLGGASGVEPAKVVVIGGGVVGLNAIRVAVGMGANVVVLDCSLNRLKELDIIFCKRVNTIYSTSDAIEGYVKEADLVIGAVLIPGAASPKLVTRKMLKTMKKGAVIVDVAIDQGGCFETSKATTHEEPTYEIDGVIHYCVANMPSGVARTSTFALTNATMPYMIELANKGYHQAFLDNEHLRNGLNIYKGNVTYEAVAKNLGYTYLTALDALA
ncbi:MAG: alanine dehydrogenase [bacterium]|jgi:alanine dehydrogenase